MIFIYKENKTKKKLKPVKAESIPDALEILKAVNVNVKGIEFFTEEQKLEYEEARREKNTINRLLS